MSSSFSQHTKTSCEGAFSGLEEAFFRNGDLVPMTYMFVLPNGYIKFVDLQANSKSHPGFGSLIEGL
jgi:hypothetical protein